MWAVFGAILGFIGGLVVAHFSALLQRRNWQLQEAAKVYAQLLAVGDEAMRQMNTLVLSAENLAAAVQPPDTVRSVAKRNPDMGRQYEQVCRMETDFRASENRALRHLLEHAWMLERHEEIRACLEQVKASYQRDCVTLRMCLEKLEDMRQQMIDEQLAQRPAVDHWFAAMEELRNRVAAKYFHDKGLSPTISASASAAVRK